MRTLLPCLVMLPLLGCVKPPAPESAPPTLVRAAHPLQQDSVVYRDFVGEVQATNEIEVRSKVTGLVLGLEFKEGQTVQDGQVLYRLDAESLKAEVTKTKGQLRDAEAALGKADLDVKRYRPLAEKGAIPRRQLDDALSSQEQARAGVSSARAQVEQAELAAKDAVIRSPYNGRIGRSAVNVGSLVSANQTVLATISTTDTVSVDFAFSESDYLTLVKPYFERRRPTDPPVVAEVELFLADGSAYPHKGHINFADRAFSASTGTFPLGAIFPNPEEVLRPGMYGRVRIAVDRRRGALLVPQRAVQELLGKTFLSLVDGAGKVERRAVQMGPRVGPDWIVEGGVSPQDLVIVEGHHKVRPGSPVQVELIGAPAKPGGGQSPPPAG